MIYLDNAATTRVCAEALSELIRFNDELYFNSSSIYHNAIENSKYLLSAKESICNILGTKYDKNLVFTGSATEANNMALLGTLTKRTKQILVSSGEHPSVYNTALELLNRGYDVKFIPLQENGEIDYVALEDLLKQSETSIISVMMVSNETGAINDIKKVSELRDKYAPEALLHSDCVQAFGKIKFNVDKLKIDLCSISAHKIYGPKGTGALYFTKRSKIKSIIFGGGQELNLRSGTENLAQIMAFKKTSEMMAVNQEKNYNYILDLKNAFLNELKSIQFNNNSLQSSSPYIISLTFNGVRGETLANALEAKGVLISTGSACSSKKIGNRTLEQMKVKNVIGSVRVSFSINNTLDEVVEAGKILKETYIDLYQKLN